jgi:hypothetical protein
MNGGILAIWRLLGSGFRFSSHPNKTARSPSFSICTKGPVRKPSVLQHRGARFVSQEFDLGEVEIDFSSFVPRGANRKKYFLVKEDRALKDDILKSILETDEGDISRVLKEAGLEDEAAGVLEAAAKLLKAYKDELPQSALQILVKASGVPEPQTAAKSHSKEEGAGGERKGGCSWDGPLQRSPGEDGPCHPGHCKAAPVGEYCHQSRGQRGQSSDYPG